MSWRVAGDVSRLPTFGFGARSTPWWGTLAFIAIEGCGFAIIAGAYLYLVVVNTQWPLSAPPPNHWPGTIITILLLASLWPNYWTAAVARSENLTKVQIGLIVMSAVAVIAIAIRAFEFAHLNVRWDQNAYGSILWIVLGLHATHLVTDAVDTWVLTVLMFTRHAQPRRFSDVTDNAFYWYFVVASWLPLYGLIYWVPRL
jgi:cytochrome c oxidase subunit 3